METTARLVKFGLGSEVVYYPNRRTVTGYGNPEHPHSSKGVEDGTPVIDVRDAVRTERGFRWVFEGPMVNVDLEDGEVDRLAVSNMGGLSAGIIEEFTKHHAGVAAAVASHVTKKPDELGGLDEVSVPEYIRGWREHGARIGMYMDGEIVWED